MLRHAVGHGQTAVSIVTFVRRYLHILPFCLVVIAIGGVVGWAVLRYPISTDERRALDAAREAHQEEANRQAAESSRRTAAKTARAIELCRIKQVCANYAKIRQECAIAGNFWLCVDVRMGKQGFSPAAACTDDGQIVAPPTNMPGRGECFLLP
jgi:hypothetical protein